LASTSRGAALTSREALDEGFVNVGHGGPHRRSEAATRFAIVVLATPEPDTTVKMAANMSSSFGQQEVAARHRGAPPHARRCARRASGAARGSLIARTTPKPSAASVSNVAGSEPAAPPEVSTTPSPKPAHRSDVAASEPELAPDALETPEPVALRAQ
jgi:hypothetical protein